ncbi:MAG: A/G-specific adenine glycosylase [Buchnera aphidicola (Periphyllus aceris)]|nr:A/G-specific adenine glycosylase [Buchnera aphidicola (Periphyllus aceris)]
MNYIFNFSREIINWFHFHGRKKLPWQINKNIYKTWISEIMLQQTQVEVVIPYFKKFLKKFSNIKKLSQSSLNDILFIWSGLGFYNRATNIYKAAQIIKKKHNNIIPKNFKDLIKLPGIGKSTAGAILSLTFNYFFPILDGNIKRVIQRFYNLNEKNYQLEKRIWKKLSNLLPIHNSGKFNQSMMDLGKIICTFKKPKCLICPLNIKCLTFIKKKFNIKNIHKKKKKIKCWFILIKYKNLFYLKQQKQKIWKNLYYFPIFYKKKKMFQWIKKKKIILKKKKNKKILYHLNNYTLSIKYFFTKINKKKNFISKNKKKIWFNTKNPQKIGIPAIVKKIFLERKKNKIKKKL